MENRASHLTQRMPSEEAYVIRDIPFLWYSVVLCELLSPVHVCGHVPLMSSADVRLQTCWLSFNNLYLRASACIWSHGIPHTMGDEFRQDHIGQAVVLVLTHLLQHSEYTWTDVRFRRRKYNTDVSNESTRVIMILNLLIMAKSRCFRSPFAKTETRRIYICM